MAGDNKLLNKPSLKACNYAVFDEGLNPYIYESEEYKDYFNNCGDSKDWLYPFKNIVISYKGKKVCCRIILNFYGPAMAIN
jgi:hypothetical protein